MKYYFWIIILLITKVFAQSNARTPVVFVHSGDESGAAIIVGKEDEYVYLLTALHVIQDARDIELTFNGNFHAKAAVLNSDQETDIVAIRAVIPKGLVIDNSYFASTRELVFNQPVYVIGHPLGEKWDVISSKIKTPNKGTGRFSITPENINPGASGGAVINGQCEIVGMVQSVEPQFAMCRSINVLLDLCDLEDWNVPTNLLKGIDCDLEGTVSEQFRWPGIGLFGAFLISSAKIKDSVGNALPASLVNNKLGYSFGASSVSGFSKNFALCVGLHNTYSGFVRTTILDTIQAVQNVQMVNLETDMSLLGRMNVNRNRNFFLVLKGGGAFFTRVKYKNVYTGINPITLIPGSGTIEDRKLLNRVGVGYSSGFGFQLYSRKSGILHFMWEQHEELTNIFNREKFIAREKVGIGYNSFLLMYFF